MVISHYTFPLPNNGERYDLSQAELIELLDKAYNSGFEYARDIYDPERQGVLTWTSSKDQDDPNKWNIFNS